MPEHYDVLIKNGLIVDGTGKPGYKGSLGIQGERIAALGELVGSADHEIDAQGKVICPGFVDPHSHADVTLLKYPRAENLVMQGITTVIAGNCGMSLAPFPAEGSSDILNALKNALGGDLDPSWRSFDEWLSFVEQFKISVNYAPLVGHSMLRTATMGMQTFRCATDAEIHAMESLTEEAMRSGAFGLSAGLDGAWPGAYADIDEEIVPLAKIAQKYGGFYAPHTRFHQNQWYASSPDQHGYGIYHGPKGEIFAGRYHGLLETVEICRKANGIPANIAHFTPAYIVPIPQPAYLAEAVARATLEEIIDKAWESGLKVMFNVVAWDHHIGGWTPIIDSFYSFQLFLPQWLRQMKKADFAASLKDRDFREKIKDLVYSGTFKFNMVNPAAEPYWMDNSKVLTCTNPENIGKTIGEIARQRQPGSVKKAAYDESLEVLFDILVEDPQAGWVHFIDMRHDGVLPTFLKHHAASPCTDGFALSQDIRYEDGLFLYGVCPNYYSMFPHYIDTYTKQEPVLSLEEAIRKATSVPACEVLGLDDRGILKEGAFADVLVFDYATIGQAGDYLTPTLAPNGICQVLVNGALVYENKQHTGARPGKVLRNT
jgi:N-acyl-D-amino-acid deacylase